MPETQNPNQPQTSKQHPVPQNVMDVEFKLIGELTLKQFGFLAGGGIISYLLFISPLFFLFKWPLILLCGGGVILIAFLPFQERTLDKWVINFFTAITRPTLRIWRKSPAPPLFLLSDYAQFLAHEVITLTPTKSRRKLQEYLEGAKEEKPKSKLDLEEEQFLKSLSLGLAVPSVVKTAKPVGLEEIEEVEVVEAKKPEEAPLPEVVIPAFEQRKSAVSRKGALASEINFATQKVFAVQEAGGPTKFVTTIRSVRPGRKLSATPFLEGEIILPIRGERVIGEAPELPSAVAPSVTTPLVVTPPAPTPPSPMAPPSRAPVPPPVPTAPEEKGLDEKSKKLTSQIEILTKRLKELKKEAEVPAVEKPQTVLESTKKTIEFYEKQIEELKRQNLGLQEEAKRQEELKRFAEELSAANKEYQKKLAEAREENVRLAGEAQTIKSEIGKMRGLSEEVKTEKGAYEKRLKELEGRLEKIGEEKEKSVDEIARLQKELAEARRRIEEKGRPEEAEIPKVKPEVKVVEKKAPEVIKPPAIASDIPNVINGIVKTGEDKIVENAVIMVRDASGHPVRALKTNNIGQFAISTPLPNGTYRIEISAEGLGFDIIELTLAGTVLEPIEIKAKNE